jgi:type II secretory pathway component PulK
MNTVIFIRPAIVFCALAVLASTSAEHPRGAASNENKTPAASNATAAKLVDINTADPGALETVPGIGTDFADAVIASRPFKSVDDLQRVPGITAERMAQIRGRVTASPVPTNYARPAKKPMGPPSKAAPVNDGKATDSKVVTERYDRASAEKPAEKK